MSKFKNANFEAYAAAIRQRESSGDYTKVNEGGYTGAYQFGKSALIDAGFMDRDGNWTSYAQSLGVNSMEDFKNNSEAQDTAFQNLTEKNWDYLRDYLPYVGETIGGVPITVSGLLAGAHLVGNGDVKKFLDSNGTIVRADGNGTPITEYMKKFAGYDFKFDNNRKGFGGVVEPQPTAVPYLAQTEALEPAFGATEWLQRPTSPNVLAPDSAPPSPPSATAPRVASAPASVPYVDGTRRAQQALDHPVPAPGAAPWDLSDRFGRWTTNGSVSGPVTSGANGGLGRTGDRTDLGAGSPQFAQSGVDSFNSSSPTLLSQGAAALAAAYYNRDSSSFGGLTSPMPGSVPFANSPGSLASPSPEAITTTPSSPPGQLLFHALLAARRDHGPNAWTTPLSDYPPTLPTQPALGGLPGMLARAGAFDPPAGGLLGLLQEIMRNHPDDDVTA